MNGYESLSTSSIGASPNGTDNSSIATIGINAFNSPPEAHDDFYYILHDTSVSGRAHAEDPDGDPLTYHQASGPSNGTLTFNSDGYFTYTPIANYVGIDSFTFYVSDGIDNSNTATIEINVLNSPPEAHDDFYYILHNTSASGRAHAEDPDGDPLTYHQASGPSNGTLTLNSDGYFTYTPNANYVGIDSFTFYVSDGIDNSNTATIEITVSNSAPEAYNDWYYTVHDTPVNGWANAWDPDGDALTYHQVSGPSNGTLNLNSDGQFTYTPSPYYVGIDSFTFYASDGIADSNIATIEIEIDGPSFSLMTLSDLDPRADEPHLIYGESTDNTGKVEINIPADFTGGNVRIKLGGEAIRDTDYQLDLPSWITNSFSGDVWTLALPAGPATFTIDIIALQDGVEPGGPNESEVERVTFSWDTGQSFPGIGLTGSAYVDIHDKLEGAELVATVAETSELGPPPGVFSLQPEDASHTLHTSIQWQIESNDEEQASWYRAILGTDYWLEDDDPTPLTFNETAPGSGIWRSNPRWVQHNDDFQLRVHAMNDRILEGSETVNARALILPLIGAAPLDPWTSEEVVTITEEYYDANVRLDDYGCSCVCASCSSGIEITPNAADGSGVLVVADGRVQVMFGNADGAYRSMRVGLTLPEDKVVPESIDVFLQLIEADVRADDTPKSLGRKPIDVGSNLTSEITFNVPAEASPGDELWFSIQVDLSSQVAGGPLMGGKVVPVELLAHPNFPSGLPGGGSISTEDKYSGWVGHINPGIRNQSASAIAPNFAPGTQVVGVDFLLRNQTMLVPAAGGNSGGMVEFQQGAMLFRADGETSWFVNGSGTSPGTQDVLSGDDITDRYGHIRRFNANGELVQRIDAAGNTTSYAYSSGVLASIVDPRGQTTTFNHFVHPTSGLDAVEIQTINSVGSPAANESVVLSYLPYTPSSDGYLSIVYDDPDGLGPRAAREERLICVGPGLVDTGDR